MSGTDATATGMDRFAGAPERCATMVHAMAARVDRAAR